MFYFFRSYFYETWTIKVYQVGEKNTQEIQNIKSVFFTTIEKVLLHKDLSAEIAWTIQLFQAIFCSHKPINYN